MIDEMNAILTPEEIKDIESIGITLNSRTDKAWRNRKEARNRDDRDGEVGIVSKTF